MQLAFDFTAPIPVPPPAAPPVGTRQDAVVAGTSLRGATNYHAGLAAEDAVARTYEATGAEVVQARFRSRHGEVDLVVRDAGVVVFVEVKKARTHDAALARIGRRQFDRIHAAASEFIAGEPRGQMTEVRFDVGTVDARGEVLLHPGILAHF